MTSTDHQVLWSEACLASKAVCWPAETRPRNPQASYYRARYYDSAVGRFISEDPTNFAVGPNFYPYAANNPAALVDPAGLTPGTNWNFFWDWLLEHGSGHDGDTRWYAGGSRNWSGSIELAEMINSPGAQYMRDQFKQNGCKDILHSNYGTLRAAWDTVLPHMHWGDTSAQVGGFTFAVVSVGGGNVEFRIQILADQQDLNLARRSGKWEFRNGQEAQVVLHGGLAIDETTGKVDHELSRADNGLSIFPVRRRFGKIKLIVNEDLNLSFSKSPS